VRPTNMACSVQDVQGDPKWTTLQAQRFSPFFNAAVAKFGNFRRS